MSVLAGLFMKNCATCGATFGKEEFSGSYCRACQRARRKADERVLAVVKAKNVPCADCGDAFHPVCMDLDHVRGEKMFAVNEATAMHHTLDEIEMELKKCEVRCANCHRLRHFGDYRT